MLGRISNARQRAAQCSALSDAVAPVGASLLVPLLVVFALEVPADAIDRIVSPFVGMAVRRDSRCVPPTRKE